MADKEQLIKQISAAGRVLARLGLVTARAGNLSCRLDAKRILITGSGTALGRLTPADIVTVDLVSGAAVGRRTRKPSSELPLHRRIHQTFSDSAVVHCHPPLINAYFCIYPDMRYLTFESRYYLGELPVIDQKTLTVTDPEPVLEALKNSGMVVARNHGVFSRADNFNDALERVQILEEAVRVYALARLFNKDKLDALDKELKKKFARSG